MARKLLRLILLNPVQTHLQFVMPAIPDHFPVSVIMESRPSSSIWQDTYWDAVGVCSASDQPPGEIPDNGVKVINRGEIKQIVYSSLKLRLFLDECESYYHNLMSPKPGCFVIAREDENGCPVPFLVSLSFDEAHAYQEGDDLVYAVPIPPELYRWMEEYVIEHYAPMKRKKRKRINWKDGQ